MNTLSSNWLTEGLIDYEYKKYILLAYFKEVKNNFNASKLYPFFSDLIFHFQNLQVIKEKKTLLKSAFPERLSGTDFENLKIVYEKICHDDELMKEIEDIIQFSIPQFQKYLHEGKQLYDFFEKNISLSAVGVTPLYPDFGYVLLSEERSKAIRVYEYQITIFQSAQEKYRGIHTKYVECVRKSITHTLENIKLDLIKRYAHMPNPAAYSIHAHMSMPLEETLLPVAKRALVRYISTLSDG